MNTVFILGAPGVGKTHLVRALLGDDTELVDSPKWTLRKDGSIAAAGHYTGEDFDGADTIPYDGAAAAAEYLRAHLTRYPMVLLDGDRMCSRTTLESVSKFSEPLAILLDAPDSVLQERRALRGSDQNASWIKGRQTKAQRFFDEFPGDKVRIDATDPEMVSNVQAWLEGNPVAVQVAPELTQLLMDISGLNLDPKNARTHDDRNINLIARSLLRFGQRKPVVVQKNGMVIRAGNGTVQAAQQLAWGKIAAVVVDEDDAEATAFGLVDNRTSELSGWDSAMLSGLMEDLTDDLDFAADDLGWDDAEMEALFYEGLPASPPELAGLELPEPSRLEAPDIKGEDTRNAYLALVYKTDEDKQAWLKRLGLPENTKKTWLTLKDMEERVGKA
jgi:ParB-like chromosome segregation protein Spo0J